MIVRTFLAALVLAAVILLAVALLGGDDAPGPQVAEGSVLLFRHALTDQSQTDADPTARGGCDQQRNLSPEGVAQAQRIGEALRELPVTQVYTSPFCRTVDTARAFQAGPVATTDALLSTTAALDDAGRQAIIDAGRDLVEAHQGGDGIVVMVTHTQNIEALTGLLVDEGDAVQLPAVGEPTVIRAEDW